MNVRNSAGLLLILLGYTLILLRARSKGDLTLSTGIWPIIGQLGDALYIIGTIMIVLGVLMIAPDLGDILTDGGDDEASAMGVLLGHIPR
jgi:hypothetical protein